jgi:hypothetical protein
MQRYRFRYPGWTAKAVKMGSSENLPLAGSFPLPRIPVTICILCISEASNAPKLQEHAAILHRGLVRTRKS